MSASVAERSASDRGEGRPDPRTEIRMTTLHAARGANYWSQRPVVRMDLSVGAYDQISSADVHGFADSMIAAMPGLIEHRCSIGERGGFVTRLRRGTFAPHIVEHVALELQTMIGHDVGYGKTRGGDMEGEYTLVFEHLHEQVGLRAAALALETVQRAFAGQLESVDAFTTELAALAKTQDVPDLQQRVLCGITGGAGRSEARAEMIRRGVPESKLIVDVSPSYILQAGLPYARSEMAVVLDDEPRDVPERYQDPERAAQLVSVVADAVYRGGLVVAPAKAWEVQDRARDQDCVIAVFAADDDVTERDEKHARAVALVERGRILVDTDGTARDAGPLREDLPAASQVAAALATQCWTSGCPTR